MSAEPAFESLAPAVRGFLAETGIDEPTPPQVRAWPLIAKGKDVLIVAPTGSGKTEAALLPLLSRLVSEGRGEGISMLYVTPMRALNRDMLKRLQSWCGRLGLTVDIRHGDTPQAQRARQAAHPPDVMVTTPETLQAILPGRRMRDNLSRLKAVVVDELHNLVESKRGVQLSVGLQRLRKVAPPLPADCPFSHGRHAGGCGEVPLRRRGERGSSRTCSEGVRLCDRVPGPRPAEPDDGKGDLLCP